MYGRKEVDEEDESGDCDGCWAFLLGVEAAVISVEGSESDLTTAT